MPTKSQVQGVSAELASRASIPAHVKAVLEALPVDAHPMTQFITAITALQVGSCHTAPARHMTQQQQRATFVPPCLLPWLLIPLAMLVLCSQASRPAGS